MTPAQRTQMIKSITRVTEEGIYGFFFEYRFLSNFHAVPILFEGEIYPSTENAYQAAKTLNLTDRKRIAVMEPNKAKFAGKQVEIRPDWDDTKLKIMAEINTYKYENNSELLNKLLATGDKYLEETNYWGDRFWGVCKDSGSNHLGKILMKIRTQLL